MSQYNKKENNPMKMDKEKKKKENRQRIWTDNSKRRHKYVWQTWNISQHH